MRTHIQPNTDINKPVWVCVFYSGMRNFVTSNLEETGYTTLRDAIPYLRNLSKRGGVSYVIISNFTLQQLRDMNHAKR